MGKKVAVKGNKIFPKIKNRVLVLGVPDMKPTKHHIIPSSRIKEPLYKRYINLIKDRCLENLCEVLSNLHQDYHRLFASLIPLEILAVLVVKFWGGQSFWLEYYLEDIEYFNNDIKLLI